MFTEEQGMAIEWNKGPLLVLGTPGSGKTTVIINRINNLIYGYNVLPSNILVITFTKAAANSMKERFLDLTELEDTRVRFGTFHSFFYWIIRTAYSNRGELKVISEGDKRQVIRSILLEINRELYDNDEIISNAISQLSVIASDMIHIDNYYSTSMSQSDFRLMYNKYQQYKKDNGLLDFDDMLSQCYALLRERNDIRSRIREMYPYIMVDEFQDTNLLQYEILKLLAYPDGNIYVVGDDDQSIYGFRGARPDILKSFVKEFDNVNVIRLSYNFRCPINIVNASSEMIADNNNRFDKELKSARSEYGSVDVINISDVTKENNEIINKVRDALARGVKPSDIAVLYRTNIEPRRLMYRLREEGIDFSVRDSLPDIFSHPVVIPILSYIYYSLGDHKRSTFINFMNKPVRYISRDLLLKEEVEIEELIRLTEDKDYLNQALRRLNSELRTISKLSPYAAVNYIREAIGYNKYLKKKAEENSADFDEYMDVLNEFQAMMKEPEDFAEMDDMIRDYRAMLKASINEGQSKDGIQLMTLHSAKGLEFDEVHIINAVEGFIPHKKSKSVYEIEEERRMFYVGMTRSRDRLYIYVPRIMNDKPCSASRFIKR